MARERQRVPGVDLAIQIRHREIGPVDGRAERHWPALPYSFGMRKVLLIIMLPEAMNNSDSGWNSQGPRSQPPP